VGRAADDFSRADYFARGSQRAIVLADVHAIGIELGSKLRVIVDDERHAGSSTNWKNFFSHIANLTDVAALRAKLQNIGATGNELQCSSHSIGLRDIAEIKNRVELPIGGAVTGHESAGEKLRAQALRSSR
jgi:hypothetical protein